MMISHNLRSAQQSESQTQDSYIKREKERNQKRMIKLLTADFASYDNNNDLVWAQPCKTTTNISKATPLMEEIQQKMDHFIKNSPSSIIRRQEKLSVPQFIKERDEQVKQVKQFRSQFKDNFEYDESIVQQVWIPITASFILIFIILLFTELFMSPKLQ